MYHDGSVRIIRAINAYFDAMEQLAKNMLPIYAKALGMDSDYFTDAFKIPTVRLRLSHYPPRAKRHKEGTCDERKIAKDETDSKHEQYGIAPHVDTTFFTLLISSGPGLAIQVGDQNDSVGNIHSNKASIYDKQESETDNASTRRTQEWIQVPSVPGAILVNAGQLLRQITNDQWKAARHYAVNPEPTERFSCTKYI